MPAPRANRRDGSAETEAQHRGTKNEFMFCRPLSSQPVTALLHADDADTLKSLWYGKLFPGGENAK